MIRSREPGLVTEFMEKFAQHLPGFQMFAGDGAGHFGMVRRTRADFLQGVSRFLDILHSEQSGAAREVPAKAGVLLHDGPAAGEVGSRSIAEPSGFKRDEDIFAHAEFGERIANVISKRVKADGCLMSGNHTPAALL